jgi:NAD(P)-dependent dehydrogenase (short-subunit alcohol dehydrogenase family)
LTSIYPAIDPQTHFDNKTFKGKTALITGASRGIGATMALFFAKAGAAVILVARRQEVLDETKSYIISQVKDAQVFAITADVKDPKRAEEAVKAAVEHFGRLDILVANAGTSTMWNKSTVLLH